MSIVASELKTRYQGLVAPGNDSAFYALLNEADERLLFSGRWHWARTPLTLQVNADNEVELPSGYKAIVGARINGEGVGVNWQESEWFETGPGETIPIEGAKTYLVDLGLVVAGSDTEGVRTYRLSRVSDDITAVEVLARYEASLLDSDASVTRCPHHGALKLMMMAIVYENASEESKAENYRAMAQRELDKHEAAYRGIAKRIYKPSLTQPLPRRSRTGFP